MQNAWAKRKYIWGFGGKAIRDQNENLDVYGRIILKWILGKENGAV
jgi:hypothetical protein